MGYSPVAKLFKAEEQKQKEQDSLNKSLIRMSRRIDQLEEDNKYFKMHIGELEHTIHQLTNGK